MTTGGSKYDDQSNRNERWPSNKWCPVYYKKTKGWVNAYYPLTLDGVRLGERLSQPRG